MPNALDSKWLPDKKLMDESSDWILAKLPFWLRWAPILTVVFILGLAMAAKMIKIPVPHSIPIAVQEVQNSEIFSMVVLHSPEIDNIPTIGMPVILRASTHEGIVSRAPGRIVGVEPETQHVTITVELNKPQEIGGTGVLLVATGSQTLGSVLLQKLTARGTN